MNQYDLFLNFAYITNEPNCEILAIDHPNAVSKTQVNEKYMFDFRNTNLQCSLLDYLFILLSKKEEQSIFNSSDDFKLSPGNDKFATVLHLQHIVKLLIENDDFDYTLNMCSIPTQSLLTIQFAEIDKICTSLLSLGATLDHDIKTRYRNSFTSKVEDIENFYMVRMSKKRNILNDLPDELQREVRRKIGGQKKSRRNSRKKIRL